MGHKGTIFQYLSNAMIGGRTKTTEGRKRKVEDLCDGMVEHNITGKRSNHLNVWSNMMGGPNLQLRWSRKDSMQERICGMKEELPRELRTKFTLSRLHKYITVCSDKTHYC